MEKELKLMELNDEDLDIVNGGVSLKSVTDKGIFEKVDSEGWDKGFYTAPKD